MHSGMDKQNATGVLFLLPSSNFTGISKIQGKNSGGQGSSWAAEREEKYFSHFLHPFITGFSFLFLTFFFE